MSFAVELTVDVLSDEASGSIERAHVPQSGCQDSALLLCTALSMEEQPPSLTANVLLKAKNLPMYWALQRWHSPFGVAAREAGIMVIEGPNDATAHRGAKTK